MEIEGAGYNAKNEVETRFIFLDDFDTGTGWLCGRECEFAYDRAIALRHTQNCANTQRNASANEYACAKPHNPSHTHSNTRTRHLHRHR